MNIQQYAPRRDIVYTGDSRFAYCLDTVRIANGGPVFSQSGDLLINRYQLFSAVVTNTAVPGAGTSYCAAHIASALALKPRKVVIQVGTADTFGDPNAWTNNISAWQSLLTALSGVPFVYVTEPMYFTSAAAYATWNSSLARMQSYNASLAAFVAGFPNVKWVPVNAWMVNPVTGYVIQSYTWDSIHPSETGYGRFWQALDNLSFS